MVVVQSIIPSKAGDYRPTNVWVHQKFVLGPFVDATVTPAEPDDPYQPVERFLS